MTDKREILTNLITADLPGLTDTALADLYSVEQRLLNGSSLKTIRDISADNLIKEFFNTHQINSSANTLYNYRQILRDFLQNIQGNLNTNTISEYFRSKQWGTNTYRRNAILIKRFLFFIFTNNYTQIDLSSCINLPSKVDRRAFCPASEQVKSCIEAIDIICLDAEERLRFNTIFRLFIKTGLRRSELLNLDVEDIDFIIGTIIIRKTKNRDVKVINMDDNLKEILSAYLGHFRYQSGPLFRGIQGKRLCKQSLNNAFQKIKARAGLPKEFKIHSFRRYFINELRKNKIDLAVIQKLAGHRDIRTTEIYCNIGDEEKREALETISI